MHTVAIGCMALVIMAFAVGPGLVVWFVIAEIFPVEAQVEYELPEGCIKDMQ